jgi:hypothetical protein
MCDDDDDDDDDVLLLSTSEESKLIENQIQAINVHARQSARAH